MKQKALITILIVLFMIGSVGAASVTNIKSPKGTIEDSRNVEIKFSLDEELTGCWLEIGTSDGTSYGNHSAGDIITSKSGKTYNHSTYAFLIDSAVTGHHNVSIYCGATALASTLVKTLYFDLRVVTPKATSPIASEIKDSKNVNLRATIPVAITSADYGCQYKFDSSNGTSEGWVDLASTDNLTWYNSSVFTSTIDSSAGKTHNITYRCNDTSGFSTGEVIQFKVDSTAPTYTTGEIGRAHTHTHTQPVVVVTVMKTMVHRI